MIVVDVGSETYGEEESFLKLIEMFKPTTLWKIDPLGRNEIDTYDGCFFRSIAAAAWTRNGTIEFGVGADSGLNATAMGEKTECGEWTQTLIVPCFDFSTWLETIGPCVVKFDAEGAEYDILEKMITDGTDHLMEPLLVEWHDWKLGDEPAYRARRESILKRLNCEVRGW